MKFAQRAIATGTFVFLASLSIYGQTPGNTAERSPVLDEGVAPHNGLDEIYRRFAEGYKKLDPALVANLYSETAAYLAPGEEGAEGVRAKYRHKMVGEAPGPEQPIRRADEFTVAVGYWLAASERYFFSASIH